MDKGNQPHLQLGRHMYMYVATEAL